MVLTKNSIKLDSTTKALEKSTGEFISSASDLTESMNGLKDVTEKHNSSLKDMVASVGKWTAAIGVPVAAYGAYKGLTGAGKLGLGAG